MDLGVHRAIPSEAKRKVLPMQALLEATLTGCQRSNGPCYSDHMKIDNALDHSHEKSPHLPLVQAVGLGAHRVIPSEAKRKVYRIQALFQATLTGDQRSNER